VLGFALATTKQNAYHSGLVAECHLEPEWIAEPEGVRVVNGALGR
jgi:hypothetical protein